MVKTINDKIFGVSLANKNIEVQTFSCLKIKKTNEVRSGFLMTIPDSKLDR